ncbi:MAG: dipeptide/oligopeptide/nickel ABC transporter permease/ATP-binding protein [Acidimicrobiia bacterium]
MTDALAAAEVSVATTPTTGQRRLRGITRRPTALVGLVGVTVILVVAVFAPMLAPSDPSVQDLSNILAPPMWVNGGSAENLLGTDALGRDLASRLMFGARNSLLVSVSAMLIASTLGLTTGLVAGFLGGKIDSVLMRLGDIQLAFPFILLAIAFLGVLTNRTPLHLIVVLGIPGWIVYARVVRSRVLAERESQYVQAAAALGASRTRQLLRYILPSVWHVVPVIALLDVGFLVIMESTLSFLGIGLPPRDPSWGAILAEGRRNMLISPWLPILPGLAIMATVLSLNLVADGLADVLDPKLRKGTFRRVILRRPAPPEPYPQDLHVLTVRDLHVEFPLRDRVVRGVRGVSFDLPRGSTLGIVGESGSGKSVTALSIMQLLDSPGRVTRGRIVFDGEDLARIPDRRMAALRGRRLAMIFQIPTTSLNPVLSIGFQMAEAVRSHGPQADTAGVVREGLRSVGIGDIERILRQYPFQLSGGMNQRVMIAMAMSAHPDLLIADEPTTALDVTTQAQILEELQRLTSGQNTSLILISHDLALVAEYANLVMVMYAGQVCEFGPVADVVGEPHHPYTRALIESVPRADLLEGAALAAIPGELPDPTTMTEGCPFAPRCPSVMDICREVNPDQYEVGPAHRAACHLWSPQSVEVRAR